MGVLLAKGEGVPPNVSEAVRYYKMAADQGLAQAQLAMQWLSLFLQLIVPTVG